MNKIEPYDFFICRLEDNEDRGLVMRRIKVRENTSADVKNQLKYDIAESRLSLEEE